MVKKTPKIRALLLVVLIAVSAIFVLKSQSLKPTSPQTSKVTVEASFYPLADFARQIGQEYVEVHTLTPAGAEPHDFEPSPQDLIKLQTSRLVIYNGAGFEPWVSKVNQEDRINNHWVEATSGLSLLSTSEAGETFDPHVWMDPVLALQEVATITDGLIKIDPQHTQQYRHNAQAYQTQLLNLDTAFKNGLADCQSLTIVTSHNAFQYLARRYNLNVISISGLSPDEEPTPRKLTEVAQFVRQNQVKYIFFETLVSPKLSETIAQETGAKTIAFNPLEGLTDEEIAQGDDYLSVQYKNLEALRTALVCK